jgi:hypothetical protein
VTEARSVHKDSLLGSISHVETIIPEDGDLAGACAIVEPFEMVLLHSSVVIDAP